MSYKIIKDCISCGTCLDECPEEVIREENDQFVIDQEFCVECGACADICPVEAIINDK